MSFDPPTSSDSQAYDSAQDADRVELIGSAVVTGTVDQGTGGSSAWLVTINGVPHVIIDSGSVAVSNLPATQPVSGTVAVSAVAGTVTVDGSGHTQPVSGSVTATGPLTDTQLRASAVPVSGTVTASGPLTDTQLRATAVPVSGTFFQSTQPVSLATNTPDVTDRAARLLGHVTVDSAPTTAVTGPLTDTQLRASAVPVSFTTTTPTFKGIVNTFRTPGRAGTAGQNILSLHNATASTKVVHITKVWVDLVATVVKAVTVLPPVIRLWKVTVLPTNGTALTKNSVDSSLTSNASITVRGDASADGTGSGTTLTATLPTGTFLTEEFAPRLITAAGYEMFDRAEFLADLDSEYIVLNALEGVVVFLDYTLATQNPTTDMWIAGLRWEEY